MANPRKRVKGKFARIIVGAIIIYFLLGSWWYTNAVLAWIFLVILVAIAGYVQYKYAPWRGWLGNKDKNTLGQVVFEKVASEKEPLSPKGADKKTTSVPELGNKVLQGVKLLSSGVVGCIVLSVVGFVFAFAMIYFAGGDRPPPDRPSVVSSAYLISLAQNQSVNYPSNDYEKQAGEYISRGEYLGWKTEYESQSSWLVELNVGSNNLTVYCWRVRVGFPKGVWFLGAYTENLIQSEYIKGYPPK